MQNTLTGEIERHVQRVMNTHSDFVWLSQLLHNATGEYISPTTLKRLWGHQTDYCHPSPYTLNLLSRYLGYADYDAFKRGGCMPTMRRAPYKHAATCRQT